VERDLHKGTCRQSVRFEAVQRYRLGVVSLVVALSLASSGCSSKPDDVDLRPITSLQFTADSDFLDRIQRQLGGRAADWSRNGVGYLVYRLPNPGPGTPIRNVDVYREDSLPKAQEIYEHNRQVFTTPGSGQSWKLYREQGAGAEKWFISYQEAHLETNHGIPMWWNTKPDIYVGGVLKQNVYIEVAYSAYGSSSNYIQTINKDIRFAADLLVQATQ
jgi:hypothetical protein